MKTSSLAIDLQDQLKTESEIMYRSFSEKQKLKAEYRKMILNNETDSHERFECLEALIRLESERPFHEGRLQAIREIKRRIEK